MKGLERDWAWRSFAEADENQAAMCRMFPEGDLPRNCHDYGGDTWAAFRLPPAFFADGLKRSFTPFQVCRL